MSAVQVTWAAGTVDDVSDADIDARLTAAIPPMTPAPPLTQRVDATLSSRSSTTPRWRSAVRSPTSSRAPPRSGWRPSRRPELSRRLRTPSDCSADEVTLHVVRGGGSFGRRIYYEPAVEAARVSKAIRPPVKLMWTRNDDMRHGRVRPRSHHQIASGARGRRRADAMSTACPALSWTLAAAPGRRSSMPATSTRRSVRRFSTSASPARTTSESSPKPSMRSPTTCPPLPGARCTPPKLVRLKRSSSTRSRSVGNRPCRHAAGSS